MSNKQNTILACCGFHRSATSVTAHWIHKSGLTMGNWLMPGAESNIDGHFEDMTMVSLNDQLLTLQKTNWRFHDEISLNNTLAIEPYCHYIKSRDRIHQNSSWGIKDPRLCLFLPEWHHATNDRGRYVIVIRHWKACIQSLLKRDLDSPSPNFQYKPILAAQMWYSYNYRLLQFFKENPEKCLVIEQSELGPDYQLPQILNSRFNLSLTETELSPFKKSLTNNTIMDNSFFSFINEEESDKLNSLWEQLTFLKKSIPTSRNQETLPTSLLPKNVKIKSHIFVKSNVEQVHSLLLDQIIKGSTFNQEQWVELARKAINEFEWGIAEKVLEHIAIYSQPQPFIYIMLADCKYKLNKNNEAVLLYLKAIDLNPNNSNFFLKLGQLYLNEGQNTMAKETFIKGVEKNPDNSKWLRIAISQIIGKYT